MKSRLAIMAIFAAVALAATAQADQLILKSGKEISGKFVRADLNVVEFRVLGKIETYKTADVSQILFKEPELVNPPSGAAPASTVEPPTAAAPQSAPPVATVPRDTADQTARDDRAAQDSRTVRDEPAARDNTQPAREVPPQNAGPSISFPANTAITVRVTEAIDTDRNRIGDSFNATLDEPLVAGGQTVVPRGAEIVGNIARAKEAGAISGQAELILELTQLKVNGRTYPLQTSDYTEIGASRGKRTAAAAGGGAALGAIIGAIAGGGKGAAIGAGAGAAAGTGVGAMTKGKSIKVPAETVLEFRLQHPLNIDLP